MINTEAFNELEIAMDHIGQPLTRGAILVKPSQPDEVIATGIEKEISVLTTSPFDIGGKLSVRAVMIDEGAAETDKRLRVGSEAARWLVRARLTFFVPAGRSNNLIPTGEHMTGAVYLLTKDAPAQIDKYFDEPEETRSEKSLKTVLQTNYLHDLPIGPNEIIPAFDKTPRTIMLRNWFKQLPQNQAMAMLSPTSHGQLTKMELPTTIGWLIKDQDQEA